MRGEKHWLDLGWQHPLWDLNRFGASLAKRRGIHRDWLEELRENPRIVLPDGSSTSVSQELAALFLRYLEERDAQYKKAVGLLRTEANAMAYCAQQGFAVSYTATKNTDHHQSSKALISAVSGVAERVCRRHGITFDINPQTRCVWCINNELHVSARNLDGAIPALVNPTIVWEIKEYWGKTNGGSKMSDAVYECQLVGMEIRQFERRTSSSITHAVFIDGYDQWAARASDLRRLIDLMNQGLIDHLFIGQEVETDWEPILEGLLGR